MSGSPKYEIRRGKTRNANRVALYAFLTLLAAIVFSIIAFRYDWALGVMAVVVGFCLVGTVSSIDAKDGMLRDSLAGSAALIIVCGLIVVPIRGETINNDFTFDKTRIREAKERREWVREQGEQRRQARADSIKNAKLDEDLESVMMTPAEAAAEKSSGTVSINAETGEVRHNTAPQSTDPLYRRLRAKCGLSDAGLDRLGENSSAVMLQYAGYERTSRQMLRLIDNAIPPEAGRMDCEEVATGIVAMTN